MALRASAADNNGVDGKPVDDKQPTSKNNTTKNNITKNNITKKEAVVTSEYDGDGTAVEVQSTLSDNMKDRKAKDWDNIQDTFPATTTNKSKETYND